MTCKQGRASKCNEPVFVTQCGHSTRPPAQLLASSRLQPYFCQPPMPPHHHHYHLHQSPHQSSWLSNTSAAHRGVQPGTSCSAVRHTVLHSQHGHTEPHPSSSRLLSPQHHSRHRHMNIAFPPTTTGLSHAPGATLPLATTAMTNQYCHANCHS